MRRSIYALIASAFAGDPITAVEAARVLRHMRHEERVDAWLMRDMSPTDRKRAESADIGDGFTSYRAMILRDLRKLTVAELRQVVRTQLVLLGMLCELQAAASGGQDRQRRQSHQGGKTSAQTRRDQAETFRRAIASIKSQSPTLSDRDAVRRHLRKNDPEWSGLSESERDRTTATATRRYRRLQNK